MGQPTRWVTSRLAPRPTCSRYKLRTTAWRSNLRRLLDGRTRGLVRIRRHRQCKAQPCMEREGGSNTNGHHDFARESRISHTVTDYDQSPACWNAHTTKNPCNGALIESAA